MRRTTMIAVAAAALLLSACGGSTAADKAATATDALAVAATPAPTTAAPETTPPTTAAPTTVATVAATEAPAPTEPAPADTEPSDGGPSDTGPVGTEADGPEELIFTGDATSDYCEFARSLSDDTSVDDAFNATDPAEAEAKMTEAMSLMDEARRVAPDEIKDDVANVADFLEQLVAAMEKYEFDSIKLGEAIGTGAAPELEAVFSGVDPELERSTERLSAYDEQVCGLTS